MHLETSKQPNNPEAHGIELLVQWQSLLHEAASGGNSDARIRVFEALSAWESVRTDAEWELMQAAQYGAGKLGLRKLVEKYEDVSPIGQRR